MTPKFNLLIRRTTGEKWAEWQVNDLDMLAEHIEGLFKCIDPVNMALKMISTPEKPITAIVTGSKEANTGLRLIITEIN